MIERIESERIDYVIDRFEEEWSECSAKQISELLSEFGLSGNRDAITELLRIDIELRYRADLPVDLDTYMVKFPGLRESPDCVSQIAFEDFRGRAASGHSISLSRWRHLPGVKSQHWYKNLVIDATASRSVQRTTELQQRGDNDSAFELVLASAGFQLVKEIGKGAFSRVYLATQNELASRFVVLKIVSQTLSEPQSMAMLLHTNVVPIYSFHRIEKRSVICMPYAGSVTLDDFLRSRNNSRSRSGQSLVDTVQARIDDTKVTLDQSVSNKELDYLSPAADDSALLNPLEILGHLSCSQLATVLFEKVAAGLAHSHLRGILHGDLKPANVLIRNDGEPALLDFNLSTPLQGGRTTHLGGTLAYMSPESFLAFMGGDQRVGARSDIYSLGLMLSEFLTGQLPYPKPASIAPVDLDAAISIRKSPTDLSGSDVTPGLKAIVQRCIEFSPGDRYASADQVQQDLECERLNLPLSHASEPFSSRIKKWFRRHPRATSSGTVAAILLAMLIPLGLIAKSTHANSKKLTATLAFADFSAESEKVLSRMIAEPTRSNEFRLNLGMQTLLDFDVLKHPGDEAFVAAQHSAAERQVIRDTLLRHVSHLCYLEIARLRPLLQSGELQPKDHQLLDQLIQRADQLTAGRDSRSVLFTKAARARTAGDKKLANSLFQQARNTPTDSPTAVYLEGLRLVFRHHQDQAHALLMPLAADDSIPAQLIWTILGRAQYLDHRYEEALISYTHVINRAPESSHFLVRRGLCYQRLGRRDLSDADFTEAIRIDPHNLTALASHGDLLLQFGKLRKAVDAFTEMLSVSPGSIHALIKRAAAYERLKEHDLADRDLEEAYAANNLNEQELISRALARDDKDPEAALKDLKQADAMSPGNPLILMHMAFVNARKLFRPEEAIRLYDQVIVLQENNQVAIIDRAIACARLRRFKEAKSSLAIARSSHASPRTLYQAACVSALTPGQQNQIDGLVFLSRAIRSGYDANKLKTDPDLDALRNMDGFRGILRTYQLSKMARQRNAER